MNKYITVLIVSTLLFTSLMFNFQSNISYGQRNSLEVLISTKNKEENIKKITQDLDCILKDKEKHTYKSMSHMENTLLERKISISTINYRQIKLFKTYLDKQLINCEKKENLLIEMITQDKEEALESSNLTYTKGQWPLENYKYVSSPYGYRIHPISKKLNFHRGIDIPAPKNTSVLASDDGIVTFSGYKNGYGNVVEIDHFDNKKTLYAHNNSIIVKTGDVVKRGQVIAKVGSSGNSTGNHVHFEVKVNNKRINPLYGVNKNL